MAVTMSRFQRSNLIAGTLVVGVLLCFIAIDAMFLFGSVADVPVPDRFRVYVEIALDRVEAYRAKFGQIPDKLPDAWVFESLGVEVEYFAGPDGEFFLTAGDYTWDGVVVMYDSSKKEWYVDR